MLDIALDFRAIEYVTDLGVTVRAMRAFVDVEFPTQADTTVDFDCFVDIAAPFSVIPYSLWHDRSIRWRQQHPSGYARTCGRGNWLSVRPGSLTQA